MKIKHLILSLSLFLSWNVLASAQLSDTATISILTCRAGDDLYNMFGHTAVRVQDPTQSIDEVFNYGLFSFKEEGFMLKFMRGKLKYWVGRSTYRNFMRGYVSEKRSVIEQILNLDISQNNRLYQALLENTKNENKYYKYDFFFDNCSTRIGDILENNITLLKYSDSNESTKTFRQLLDEFNFVSPWIDFGMDLLVGTPADKEANSKDEMFLPEYLFIQMSKASLGHNPLVTETRILLDHEKEIGRRTRAKFFTPALFFALLLLLELFLFIKGSNKGWIKSYDKLIFFILGFGGVLILFMWFGTDHITTKNNLNLLWMNPLFLILLFNKSKSLYLLLSGCMVLTLIFACFLQQLHIAAIFIILICIFKLLRYYRHYNVA